MHNIENLQRISEIFWLLAEIEASEDAITRKTNGQVQGIVCLEDP